MDFGLAVRRALSQYATFSGRATRPEFWWFYLFGFLVSTALNIIDGVLRIVTGYYGLTYVAGLVLLLPTLAVTCRRLHDSGRSGWWLVGLYLAWLVGFAATIAGLVLGILVGISGGLEGDRDVGIDVGWVVAIGLGGLALLVAGFVLWLVFTTRPSDPQDNRYGPTTVIRPAWTPGAYDGYPSPYGTPGPVSQPGAPGPPAGPPAGPPTDPPADPPADPPR